ncbi:MAG: spore cortex biosynthesis protein YabQ [Eubacteriales bacterium]|nr:spore cortex biosynthesis protein YabQ [Eubacteriales bacterium]
MTAINPLPEQLWAVLYAVLAGVLCGMVYDLFRSIRWSSKSRLVELLLDALFSLLAAAGLFVLVTSAAQLRLRGFLLISAAGGWLAWDFTGGRIFRWLLRGLWAVLARIGGIPLHWCAVGLSHIHIRRKNKRNQCTISEKSRKNQKKCFPFCLRWYKIK